MKLRPTQELTQEEAAWDKGCLPFVCDFVGTGTNEIFNQFVENYSIKKGTSTVSNKLLLVAQIKRFRQTNS